MSRPWPYLFFHAVTICHLIACCVHPQTETVSAPRQALQRAHWHPGPLCATVGFGFHVTLARIMLESHKCTKFSPSQKSFSSDRLNSSPASLLTLMCSFSDKDFKLIVNSSRLIWSKELIGFHTYLHDISSQIQRLDQEIWDKLCEDYLSACCAAENLSLPCWKTQWSICLGWEIEAFSETAPSFPHAL